MHMHIYVSEPCIQMLTVCLTAESAQWANKVLILSTKNMYCAVQQFHHVHECVCVCEGLCIHILPTI